MSVTIRLTFDEDEGPVDAIEVAEYLAAEAENYTGEAPWWAVEEAGE